MKNMTRKELNMSVTKTASLFLCIFVFVVLDFIWFPVKRYFINPGTVILAFVIMAPLAFFMFWWFQHLNFKKIRAFYVSSFLLSLVTITWLMSGFFWVEGLSPLIPGCIEPYKEIFKLAFKITTPMVFLFFPVFLGFFIFMLKKHARFDWIEKIFFFLLLLNGAFVWMASTLWTILGILVFFNVNIFGN